MLRYIVEIVLVFAGIIANAVFFWYTWNEKNKGEIENALAVESWRHASYTYELAWTIQERLLHFDEIYRAHSIQNAQRLGGDSGLVRRVLA